MKIGIDISMLVYQGSGVATYTYNLVEALLDIDKAHSYHLFYSSLRRPAGFTVLQNLKKKGGHIHDLPFPPRVLKYCWNSQEVMPVEWFTGKVDIFHSSDFLRPPLMSGTKGITTIHDLTWKKYPEFHTEDIITAHERKLKRTIEHNDTIIVDSEQTKKDLYNYYPDIKNTVYKLPLGVHQRYFHPYSKSEVQKTLDTVQITTPYILYVGAIEPRKNIPTLIKAFQIIAQDYPDLNLVLAGRAGWKNEDVFSLIQTTGLSKRVQCTGYVSDDDLPKLYKGARVFVYPSLYEGYGLPPLESLASGTPVIAFNSPSISDEFTTYIAPEELANQIRAQLEHPQLYPIKIHSWQEVAQLTLDVYSAIHVAT